MVALDGAKSVCKSFVSKTYTYTWYLSMYINSSCISNKRYLPKWAKVQMIEKSVVNQNNFLSFIILFLCFLDNLINQLIDRGFNFLYVVNFWSQTRIYTTLHFVLHMDCSKKIFCMCFPLFFDVREKSYYASENSNCIFFYFTIWYQCCALPLISFCTISFKSARLISAGFFSFTCTRSILTTLGIYDVIAK